MSGYVATGIQAKRGYAVYYAEVSNIHCCNRETETPCQPYCYVGIKSRSITSPGREVARLNCDVVIITNPVTKL